MSQFNLNKRQREAVEYQGGDLLIIAGAGTGKTQVLTKRVLFFRRQIGRASCRERV